MAKKQKRISWAPIIITGMILIFIVVMALLPDSEDYVSTSKYTQSSVDDNSYESETITISGINGVKTINFPEKDVELIISGLGNKVTVTKDTKISKILLSGQDNLINLCQGIHSPELLESGLGNNINYINC